MNNTNLSLLLQHSRQGDQDAFGELISIYYRRIFTHCYQMLGSLQDAEDAVQETSIKAWTRLNLYSSKGSFLSWLYSISTNVCLDILRKQPSRSLTQEGTIPQEDMPTQLIPITEPIWIEPIPDELLAINTSDPESIYSMRESVSLAFMTILQKLPPRQRAVLLLRDVLNWKAQEVATYLDMTTSAVNSALLRGRKTLQDENYSNRYRTRLSEEKVIELLDRYILAWESRNIPSLIALLKEDAILTMPPLPIWFQGHQSIQSFFAQLIFEGNSTNRWTLHSIAVNQQPAFALYRLNEVAKTYDLFCIEVLTVIDNQISRLDHFMTPPTQTNTNHEDHWLKFFNIETYLTT